jgi:zinc finger SWIM domain-containing protein 3
MIPKIGMRFISEQEAYGFYNAYAGEIGFSVRKSGCHYVGDSLIIKTRTFCCFRQGNEFHFHYNSFSTTFIFQYLCNFI